MNMNKQLDELQSKAIKNILILLLLP